MNPAMFVETDPAFGYALEAFTGLNNGGHVTNLGNNTVTNRYVVNSNGGTTWRSMYDFSRCVAVVCRAFFIACLNLDVYANVPYPNNKSTPPNLNNGLMRQSFPPNFPFITNNNIQGSTLFERYDQMFPHYVVERELATAFATNAVMTRSCILIVPHPVMPWGVFQIMTTIVCRVHMGNYNVTARVVCVGGNINPDVPVPQWQALKNIVYPPPAPLVEPLPGHDDGSSEEGDDEDENEDEEEED